MAFHLLDRFPAHGAVVLDALIRIRESETRRNPIATDPGRTTEQEIL